MNQYPAITGEVFDTRNSVLQRINPPCLDCPAGILIKRDDLIHPIVSGNKWRKLEYNIRNARQNGVSQLVTFGGAYSNHMVATACAGAALGIKTTAFVRGDELHAADNHYLYTASLFDMELIPVDREAYRNKTGLFESRFGDKKNVLCVPEGGANQSGAEGVKRIISELNSAPDFIVHASATATTAIGLAQGLEAAGPEFRKTKIIAVAVLKNASEQETKIREAGVSHRVIVDAAFDFGGYAKTNSELMDFCRDFIRQTGILIDPVYTAKALYAIKNRYAKQSESLMFLHTGGTLGIFSDRFRKD